MFAISHIVDSIGLLFGLSGSILIWRFGLPAPVKREGILMVRDLKTEMKNPVRVKAGIIFLVVAFFLQLVSNFL